MNNSTDRFPEDRVPAATAVVPVHPKSDLAKSWFVPPIVVPAFLLLLIVARSVYAAFA